MVQSVGGGRRGTLNRRLVLQAGLDLVDEIGLGALTMRRVAERLDVEAMSLYTWVTNRDGLLDGIVEIVLDQLYDDPEVHLEPVEDWRDFLSRLAYGVRRLALDHPRAFPLVATRPPEAPWVRPPLRSLRWIEAFLSGLRSRGFSEDATIYAYRAFTSFLLGFLLLETGSITAGEPATGDGSFVAAPEGSTDEVNPRVPVAGQISPTRQPETTADPDDMFAELDGEQYPTILEMSAQLADNRSDDEFRDALTDLLDRIERESAHPADR
jgi:AcrR family transcriptional regulator